MKPSVQLRFQVSVVLLQRLSVLHFADHLLQDVAFDVPRSKPVPCHKVFTNMPPHPAWKHAAHTHTHMRARAHAHAHPKQDDEPAL